jgi:hypothetical protein
MQRRPVRAESRRGGGRVRANPTGARVHTASHLHRRRCRSQPADAVRPGCGHRERGEVPIIHHELTLTLHLSRATQANEIEESIDLLGETRVRVVPVTAPEEGEDLDCR